MYCPFHISLLLPYFSVCVSFYTFSYNPYVCSTFLFLINWALCDQHPIFQTTSHNFLRLFLFLTLLVTKFLLSSMLYHIFHSEYTIQCIRPYYMCDSCFCRKLMKYFRAPSKINAISLCLSTFLSWLHQVCCCCLRAFL